MAYIRKNMLGVVKLSSIDPYVNIDGYVVLRIENGGNEDYSLTIYQGNVEVGYAGSVSIDDNIEVSGSLDMGKIEDDWTNFGYIGIELCYDRGIIVQHEIDGEGDVVVGNVMTKMRVIDLKKDNSNNSLPFSRFH